MPIYEYLCSDCRQTFELMRPINQRDKLAECPGCQSYRGSRMVSLFSAVSKGANGASRVVAAGSACAGCSPSPTACAGCGTR